MVITPSVRVWHANQRKFMRFANALFRLVALDSVFVCTMLFTIQFNRENRYFGMSVFFVQYKIKSTRIKKSISTSIAFKNLSNRYFRFYGISFFYKTLTGVFFGKTAKI